MTRKTAQVTTLTKRTSLSHGLDKFQQQYQLSRPSLDTLQSPWYSLCSSLQLPREEGEENLGKVLQAPCQQSLNQIAKPSLSPTLARKTQMVLEQ